MRARVCAEATVGQYMYRIHTHLCTALAPVECRLSKCTLTSVCLLQSSGSPIPPAATVTPNSTPTNNTAPLTCAIALLHPEVRLVVGAVPVHTKHVMLGRNYDAHFRYAADNRSSALVINDAGSVRGPTGLVVLRKLRLLSFDKCIGTIIRNPVLRISSAQTGTRVSALNPLAAPSLHVSPAVHTTDSTVTVGYYQWCC